MKGHFYLYPPTEKGRHQKKKLRDKRKDFQDKNAENEGTVDGQGDFVCVFSCLFNFTSLFLCLGVFKKALVFRNSFCDKKCNFSILSGKC